MITILLTAVSCFGNYLPHLILQLGSGFYLILFLLIFNKIREFLRYLIEEWMMPSG